MNQTDNSTETELTQAEVSAQTRETKCTSCGAGMAFDIETGGLKCKHCGTTTEFNDTERVQRRQITNEVLGQHSKWTEARVFQCSNCGAKEVMEKKSMTVSCAFCGSNNVVASEELPGVQPDAVIPFSITEQTAVTRFKKWIRGKFFAPNAFRKGDVQKQMNKMYTPCWSFSARTENMYQGTVGRTVFRTVHTRNGTQTRSEIQWFRIHGVQWHDYKDYFYQSGERISPKNFNALKPFDLNTVRVYRQEFLSGIIAEHYTKSLETCFAEFSTFVKRDMRGRILRKHGAQHVQFLDIRTTFHDRRFNYVLLPLYISNYRFKEKLFNFYINGATGKIVGAYPKSAAKISLLVGGVIAAVVAGLAVLYFI